jgi:glyoxalase family protein
MGLGSKPITGIHHITAITSDAQKNIDFYCGVLGLRLVKLTVNFDDPGSYHLYYGDEVGHPGSILTFFAWPGAGRGRIGPPQVTTTAFSVPVAAIEYWTRRLKERGVEITASGDRFGEPTLGFTDPDGMRLELVGSPEPKGTPWAAGSVSAAFAIRGFYGVTINEEGYENTARLLTDVMGFKFLGDKSDRYRYRAGGGDGFASIVDLVCTPGAPGGSMGAGVVHHIAYRAKNDEDQLTWRQTIFGKGYNISPVMDRVYFHSIYYREPGGVLFEIATDNPGFTVDQPADQLGKKLMLPPWLEKYRGEIEEAVPPVKLP